MSTREIDIVLFGATGFVGRLTARHLAAHAPRTITVALAGRSRDKLTAVRRELGDTAQDWPLLEVDSTRHDTLDEMARRATVVVTTVGPYAEHGLPLVAACAAAGTHYVDLTGEVFFVRDSIDRYDAAAHDSGARIIHSCGADALPSDLAVLLTALAAREAGDGDLSVTQGYWRHVRGGASGGTLASLEHDIRIRRSDPAQARLGDDPYALSPDRAAEPAYDPSHSHSGVGRSRDLPGWEAPYLLSPYNGQVVRRSNALTDWSYGRGLRYQEGLYLEKSLLAPVKAAAFAVGQEALTAGFGTPTGRSILSRVLPQPGEGPSPRRMASGRFLLEVHADTERGAHWITRVGALRDPGYGGTAVMLGESALALVLNQDALPERAGVLTPATGIGAVLADRLRAQGFHVDTRRS
ncbi:putative trans-acting enoyl reductase [Austwickia sp. TVS 96-490-7B]|uniref:saccharopine dehydrogenase family protein n=1 Tax=Austwickia sp. TVS 96-490-7B TaxID=2830843 RepID=UPI001C592795|nr:saccharopine dehydrogenase NADP-binding domain-containing protein [Austwickia sp. TVS 96-490-7B]MBW3085194.1 putative trans-acting enoyl reductase [Austwickia sp. TVS 96-490-7B]